MQSGVCEGLTDATRSNVGGGLLAKASAQQTLMLTDTPLSRASPLPQGGRARHNDQVGYKAASLLLTFGSFQK